MDLNGLGTVIAFPILIDAINCDYRGIYYAIEWLK